MKVYMLKLRNKLLELKNLIFSVNELANFHYVLIYKRIYYNFT